MLCILVYIQTIQIFAMHDSEVTRFDFSPKVISSVIFLHNNPYRINASYEKQGLRIFSQQMCNVNIHVLNKDLQAIQIVNSYVYLTYMCMYMYIYIYIYSLCI